MKFAIDRLRDAQRGVSENSGGAGVETRVRELSGRWMKSAGVTGVQVVSKPDDSGTTDVETASEVKMHRHGPWLTRGDGHGHYWYECGGCGALDRWGLRFIGKSNGGDY